MIRLTNILNEQSVDKLNVLFVSDQPDDAQFGYARKLIANNIVTGVVETYRSEDDSSELNNLVYYNISSEYDLVVVYCSGLYDDSERTVIENLENILTICKRFGIPVVFITIPTTRFIKNEKVLAKKSGFAYIKQINDWIRKSKADYVVDLFTIDDDVYFKSDGVSLNKQGQNVIYKRLLNIIGQLDSSIDADFEKKKANLEDGIPYTGNINNLRKLQDKLIELGYNITDDEIQDGRYGRTTKAAVRQFQLKHGLISSGNVDSKTIKKLQSAIPLSKSNANSEIQFTYNVTKPSLSDMHVYKQILQDIGAPVTANTLTFFFAWRQFEAGTAAFNPFNTTQTYGKSTNYNTLSFGGGVQNYTSEDDGISATVMTLKNGRYDNLVRSLREDEDPISIASNLDDLDTWGSGDGPLKVLKSGRIKPKPISRSTTNIINTLSTIGAIGSAFLASRSSSGKNGKLSASQLTDVGGGFQLEPAAAAAYLAMKQASLADSEAGLKDSDWKLSDAYRPLDVQIAKFDWDLYKRTGKKKKLNTNGTIAMAYPGTSNHGLGKAIDLNGRAQQWVRKHGEKFGWSWDEGKSVNEPWHFRYKL
jgi:peptidoglycan hydrolase-like protein with peptidoglycan-binding domain